jgi:hypothetical protein
MTTDTRDLVATYIDQLESALRSLSPGRRSELIEEIRDHIADAIEALPPGDPGAVAEMLARLGSPAEIAAEAGAQVLRPDPPSRLDAFVPWVVLLGGFLFAVGWVAGIVMLWSSSTWRLRDKLLACFVWPGGLAGVVLFAGLGAAEVGSTCASPASTTAGSHTGTVGSCSGSALPAAVSIGLAVVAFAAPIVVAIHLERVRRRRLALSR